MDQLAQEKGGRANKETAEEGKNGEMREIDACIFDMLFWFAGKVKLSSKFFLRDFPLSLQQTIQAFFAPVWTDEEITLRLSVSSSYSFPAPDHEDRLPRLNGTSFF